MFTALTQYPANGDFGTVVYLLSATAVGSDADCVADSGGGTRTNATTISALTDVRSGEGAINIKCVGSYRATLVVRDGDGAEATVRNWTFEVLPRDTSIAAYGPNDRDCSNGRPSDGTPMDGEFTCDCNGTRFTGENCELAVAAGQVGTASAVVGAVLGVLALAAAVVFTLVRWQRYARSMLATDFLDQLQAMKERGEVDEMQAASGGVPRELRRGWLALIDTLGKGAFGEVWKGLLQDGGNSDIPAYMVACKVVKEASGSLDGAGVAAAEEELLKEALLMAQVETHPHLVSLVGVITRGSPKILVLSFCEHGELQGQLKKRAADGDPFSAADKCNFCAEVADGMAHLARHGFVHRDLAARNVLLGSGMVCKVADFGLSRRVQTEDNTGDYYRSSSGIIPVRWTAPEGITSQKFSSASDMWSYGITCAEVFLDGGRPYPGVGSNPEVVKMVCTRGLVHPQPSSCSDEVYRQLLRCWAFDPGQRPGFAAMLEFFQAMGVAVQRPADVASPRGGGPASAGGFDPGTANVAISPQHYNLGHQDLGVAAATSYDLGYQDTIAEAGTRYNLGHQTFTAAKLGARYDLEHHDEDVGADAPLLLFEENDTSLASSAM